MLNVLSGHFHACESRGVTANDRSRSSLSSVETWIAFHCSALFSRLEMPSENDCGLSYFSYPYDVFWGSSQKNHHASEISSRLYISSGDDVCLFHPYGASISSHNQIQKMAISFGTCAHLFCPLFDLLSHHVGHGTDHGLDLHSFLCYRISFFRHTHRHDHHDHHVRVEAVCHLLCSDLAGDLWHFAFLCLPLARCLAYLQNGACPNSFRLLLGVKGHVEGDLSFLLQFPPQCFSFFLQSSLQVLPLLPSAFSEPPSPSR
mmetsp:Transcript_48524/g.125912  ORF Transcript_48524/g.125912 Transcript_48524/m.125912 type:complete len:260 (-) Transcript_48524:396-1175(-)